VVMEHHRTATKRPKLTDAERYERFLEAAKEVGASESYEDFERVFNKVVAKRKITKATKSRPEGREPR
jgi:hypothetical protein